MTTVKTVELQVYYMTTLRTVEYLYTVREGNKLKAVASILYVLPIDDT